MCNCCMLPSGSPTNYIDLLDHVFSGSRRAKKGGDFRGFSFILTVPIHPSERAEGWYQRLRVPLCHMLSKGEEAAPRALIPWFAVYSPGEVR